MNNIIIGHAENWKPFDFRLTKQNQSWVASVTKNFWSSEDAFFGKQHFLFFFFFVDVAILLLLGGINFFFFFLSFSLSKLILVLVKTM